VDGTENIERRAAVVAAMRRKERGEWWILNAGVLRGGLDLRWKRRKPILNV
jgi:hypothetical protein